MSRTEIEQLLEAVRTGQTGITAAVDRLASPAVGDLGFATIDLHREARCGFPEVVLAEGKTPEWTEAALRRLSEAGQGALATRVEPPTAELLASVRPRRRAL